MVANVEEIQQLASPSSVDLDEDNICSILLNCKELPKIVRDAPVATVCGRILCQNLLDDLLAQSNSQDIDIQMVERLNRRKQNLSRSLGSYLVCVFIKLPGVFYTIEIDPESRSVVHWEWQSA